MMTGAAGLLRVVANGGILLFAILDHHRRIPVGHGVGRHGVMDHLLGGSKPRFQLRGIERSTEFAKRIFTAGPALV